jgi:hypothetical protein
MWQRIRQRAGQTGEMGWPDSPGWHRVWVSKMTRWSICVRRYMLPPVIYDKFDRLSVNRTSEKRGIRTIRRIAIDFVVVCEHARSEIRVPRPARAEDVVVLVLPEKPS